MNQDTPTKSAPESNAGWTRHLTTVLATWLIVVSGTSFVALLDAFH